MPPLSSHFRLAAMVMPALGIVSNVHPFLLGTLAPDAFEPDSEESFSQHHFRGSEKRISLQRFLDGTNFIFQPSDEPAWSFLCGYYCHLWLDVFYRDHGDLIPFKRPAGMSDAGLRDLLRREAEILNATFVLRFADQAVSWSAEPLMPAGLTFVSLERCSHLFQEVLSQSEKWIQLPAAFVALDEAEYAAFFNEVSRSFIDESQSAV